MVADDLLDVVVVPAAGLRLAVSAAHVVEVVALPALEPLADAPTSVVGLLQLRGEPVPVVDLRTALSRPASRPPLDASIVVVTSAGGLLGLLGDGPAAAVLHMPVRTITVADPSGAVTGTGPEGEQVLDLPRLVERAEQGRRP